MFDRFILASSYNRITEKFNMCFLSNPEAYEPSFNIAPGDSAYIITNYQTKEIKEYTFGLKYLGKKYPNPAPFLRAEANRNSNNDPNYSGAKAIFLQPETRNLIRNQRCLVLADAFVVESENKHYLVYLRNKTRPFAFAGVWDKYEGSKGKEYAFAIITTTSNKLLYKLGQNRMPVILNSWNESAWLRPGSRLSDVLNLLEAFPTSRMNAYPIDNRIKDKSLNNKSLVQPIGKKILYEPVYKFRKGRSRKERDESDLPTLAERAGLDPSKFK